MAIVHDSSAFQVNGTSGASFLHTLGSGSGSDRLVVVGVCGEANNSGNTLVTSATYNGVAGTLAGTIFNPDPASARATLYYWLDAQLPGSSGSYTCTVSTVNSDETGCVCSSYTGVAQQPPETTGSAESETGQASLSVSTTGSASSGALIYDTAAVQLFAGSGVPTAPQNERMDGNNSVLTALASDKIAASSGVASMGWSLSGTDVRDAHFVAAFAEAAAAGTLNTFFSRTP